MRHTTERGLAALAPALILIPILALAPRTSPAGTADGGALEPGAWLFSLEARAELSDHPTPETVGFGGLAPRVSYQLSDRLRLDGGLGFASRDGRLDTLNLEPGFRIRLWRGPGHRLRLLSGMSASIEVLDRVGSAGGQHSEPSSRRRHPAAGLRLVPAELELAVGRRTAFTFSADYVSILYPGGRLEGGTAGLATGIHVRFH